MWVHVTMANIQDPLDFGNNLGMKLTRENFNLTMNAFRLAEKHMSALKQWGAKGNSSLSPWALSEKHESLSFMWPTNLLARGNQRYGYCTEALSILGSLSGASGSNGHNSSSIESSSLTETGGTCALCFKKLKTYSEQTNHVKTKHWFSFSFFPNSMEAMIEDMVVEMKSLNRDAAQVPALTKDIDSTAFPCMAANCSIFIAGRSRSKSSSVSLEDDRGSFDDAGIFGSQLRQKKSGVNSPKRGASGRNLRIDTISSVALKKDGAGGTPDSPMTPSTPMTPGGLPNTPQQGRSRRGTLVEREHLMVSLKMVHHATRLAGHPGILRDIEAFMETNSKDNERKLGSVEIEKDGKKKKRRRKKRSGSQDFDEWTESSSVGTVDSLNDTFEGFTLAPLENIEEAQLEPADPVTPKEGNSKERRGKRDLRPPSNPGTPNQVADLRKEPLPTEIQLSFEDFKDRRDSLGEKQKQQIKNNIQDKGFSQSTEKERRSSSASKIKSAQANPKKTTSTTNWANVTKKSQSNSEEITIGSTMIRARLIEPKMHEIVDPGLKERMEEKKQLKAEEGAGWFKDVKKRMMVLLIVNDSNYNVVLEHGKVSGKKSLTINGKKLGVKGKQILDFGGQFKFRIAHVDMSIAVECKLSGNFKYKFFIDGIKEPILVDNWG